MCTDLHIYKPTIAKEMVIENVRVCESQWLGGNMGSIRDILPIDDTLDDCWYAYTTMHSVETPQPYTVRAAKVYLIPREWVRRIISRNGKFILMNYEFCCRQVLR